MTAYGWVIILKTHDTDSDPFVKQLLYDAAGHASTATAQGLWFILVIITILMDHDAVSMQVLGGEAWCHNSLVCLPLLINMQNGKVAKMAVNILWAKMFLGVQWVQMSAGTFALLRTARLYMNMKAMITWAKFREVWRD